MSKNLLKKIHIFQSQAEYAQHAEEVGSSDLALVKDNTKVYVTTYWRSGTNWYRVWSDGFIEQGGYYDGADTRVISFYKTFSSSSNFGIVISGCMYIKSRTTSNVSVDTNYGYVTKTNGYWYAWGY